MYAVDGSCDAAHDRPLERSRIHPSIHPARPPSARVCARAHASTASYKRSTGMQRVAVSNLEPILERLRPPSSTIPQSILDRVHPIHPSVARRHSEAKRRRACERMLSPATARRRRGRGQRGRAQQRGGPGAALTIFSVLSGFLMWP